MKKLENVMDPLTRENLLVTNVEKMGEVMQFDDKGMSKYFSENED